MTTALKQHHLPTREASQKGASFLSVFLLLVVFILAGAGAYFYVVDIVPLKSVIDDLDSTFKKTTSDTQTLRETINNKLNDLEAALNTNLQNQDVLLSQLSKGLEQQVDIAVQKHSFLGGYKDFEEKWVVQQTSYLLRKAHLILLLETDTRKATDYFEKASAILAQYANTDLAAVRLAVAKDLAKLKDVKIRDTLTHYLTLHVLINQLEQLPDHPTWVREAQPTEALSENSMLNKILTLFRFRTQEHLVARSPAATTLARQNLGLLLEQAQVGLLRRQDVIYSNALNRGQRLLATYFDTAHPRVSRMQRQIEELAGLADDLPLPDVNESIKLLEAYRVAQEENPIKAATKENIEAKRL